MKETTTTTKDAPKTIAGYVWNELNGVITVNRNQLKGIKLDLEVLNTTIEEMGGTDPMPLETYMNNKFKKLIGSKYKSYTLTGEGGSIRNVTPSIQEAHDNNDKFVRSLPDAVVIDGQVYLPDNNGNYKKPVLTFTVRADANKGMSKEDVQKQINDEVAKVVASTEDVLTETDNEVINQ